MAGAESRGPRAVVWLVCSGRRADDLGDSISEHQADRLECASEVFLLRDRAAVVSARRGKSAADALVAVHLLRVARAVDVAVAEAAAFRRSMIDPQRRAAYLEALGIDRWVARQPAAAPDREAIASLPPNPVDGESRWNELQRCIADCTRCELHRSRTQTVFGVGDPRAKWMVVGEAPGAEEDRRGEPFVGAAGQLLNAMLAAIELPRESVFIANVLKCRPPENRDPRPDEVTECLPYLHQQIAQVSPRILLAFGRFAAQNLLGTDATLAKLRGAVHRYGPNQIPVIVTYHPAYLLRTPGDKRKAWEDLKLARRVFAELPAEA